MKCKLFVISLIWLGSCVMPGPRFDEGPTHVDRLSVNLEPVADGFASPVLLVSSKDSRDRLYIVDQVGVIWVVEEGRRLQTPFLDLRDRLVDLSPFYDERGLLGLDFHPRFSENGKFFVYYSAPLRPGLSTDSWDHTTHISEFRLLNGDPTQADPASERVVLSIDKPGYNYEAGHIAFGPDGYLYIAVGDSARRPDREVGGYAQKLDNLLGKLLRIDVDGEEPYRIPPDNPLIHQGRPEIFAYGFRNPYRFSFDATAGDRFIVGDVGHALMEEIDLVIPGGNYGWPIREGMTCFNPQNWTQPLESCAGRGEIGENLIDPVLAYRHTEDVSAVIGGLVYRAEGIPSLSGAYVFGDWGRGQGRLFAASPLESLPWPFQEIKIKSSGQDAGLGQVLGFGEDNRSEIYVLVKDPRAGPDGASGRVYRISP